MIKQVNIFFVNKTSTAARSGISTGREGPVAPVPEPVLPFWD
jgi:hypothetical protein